MAVMETVDQALIIQFSDMMHERAQQIRSRLRPYVTIKKMTGDVYAYDGIGTVEARELSGRFNLTQFDTIEHFRRKISKRRFVITLPIDKHDVAGMLTDPKGIYAQACVYKMERVFDRVVVDAMFANVLTGRDFENSVTFANDGGRTVDATNGWTYEKFLEIKENFINDDVGNDSPRKMVTGITGDEHTDFMSEAELTSGDFTRQYVVDRGEINRAVGFDVVTFGANANDPIIKVNSTTRDCFAMAEGAICVGMPSEWEISVDKRPDYVQTTQIQIVGTLGAVRTEGKLIQKVQTTASA